MARKISTALHELIHSMTKDEKRSFKSYVLKSVPKEKKEDHIYLRLFDIINKQEFYNESELLEIIDDIKPQQLPGFKNYLYNNILKSLEQSCSESSVEIIIRREINQVQILYNKGLYVQCEKILNKALKAGIKYEKEILLAEIYSWKKKLILHRFSPDEENQIINKERDIYSKLDREKEYYWLWLKSALHLNKQRVSRSKTEDHNWMEKLGNSPYFANENLAISFFSKHLYYYLKATDSYIKSDFKSVLIYSLKLVDHFKRNPHQIAEDPDAYIIALNNYIVGLVMLKKFKEAATQLAGFKNISAGYKLSPISKAKVFGFYYSHLINIDSGILNFSGAERHITNFDTDLQQHYKYIRRSNLIVIYFNIVTLFFTHKAYKKCLVWTNRIFNEFTVDIREDLQAITRIISIISNYELENNDLALSQINATRHHLKKRKRLHQIEHILLKFLEKKFPKIYDLNDQVSEFQTLKAQLTELLKDDFEKEALSYFDFIAWTESKIKNQPLADVLQEKDKQIRF
ncbi:MAG: hypothetical protein HYU69_15515 [Bacteroidetes bacterium]|nr:hypothetical protein [Bacteroidota bacterium]